MVRLALRFLRWFCDTRLAPYIEGDLIQLYEENLVKHGRKRSDWKLVFQVLKLLRPSMIRAIEIGTPGHGLLKNYLVASWRNMLRRKTLTAINIFGLGSGLACFLMILLFVEHELSYDRFYPESSNIYRIYAREVGFDYLGTEYWAITPAALAPTLLSSYPDIAAITTLQPNSALLKTGPTVSFWEEGLRVDPVQFLEIFPQQFLVGDKSRAFPSRESLILTKSLAAKMYPLSNPVGQRVSVNGEARIISAVIADPPSYSSLQFSFLENIEGNERYQKELVRVPWDGMQYQTFFIPQPGADLDVLEQKFSKTMDDHWVKDLPFETDLLIQPLTDIHFQSNILADFPIKVDKTKIQVMLTIGILILILASINYVNLAIARSANRVKEVSVRKVIGSSRRALILQYLAESVLMAWIAFLLALCLLPLLTPILGILTNTAFRIDWLKYVGWLPVLIVFITFVGVVAGSYPAMFLSSIQPFKRQLDLTGNRTANGFIQSLLVIIQYAASLAIVLGAASMYLQFEFIRNKDLGFKQDQILTIQLNERIDRGAFEALRQQWLQYPGVDKVATTQDLPLNVSQSTYVNDDPGGDPSDDLPIYELRVNYDFQEIYELDLLAGELLPNRYKRDSLRRCVINESAVRAMGWTVDEAVGQTFKEDWQGGQRRIIGVVKDFHLYSLHLPIGPALVELRPHFEYISLSIHPQNLKETITYIDETIAPLLDYPYEIKFLSDHLEMMYTHDFQQARLIGFFALLTILIASIGLFGLSALKAGERTKEMGIRKVLGAKITDLTITLARRFITLASVGALLAVPLVWWAMNRWLENYAYHLTFPWWLLIVGIIGGVLLAFLTIAGQCVAKARVNPVESLRYE